MDFGVPPRDMPLSADAPLSVISRLTSTSDFLLPSASSSPGDVSCETLYVCEALEVPRCVPSSQPITTERPRSSSHISSEERRVWKEVVRTCISRWVPYH